MAVDKKDLFGWVDDYTGELLSWAIYKVTDKELARDLVQDTFLAATEKISSFKSESSPKTWLFSILNYKIIDHYRSKYKNPIPLEEHPMSRFFGADGHWLKDKMPFKWDDNEMHLLDDGQFLKVLNNCMDALPEKWSLSLKMKYLMEKNGEEICQELGISSTNFWQILHRARLNLRECIETNWFKE